MKSIFSVLLLAFLFSSSSSNKGDYSPLQCSGNIPSLFLNTIDNYVEVHEEAYKGYFGNDRDLEDLKEQLILGSAFTHNFYFSNGLLLFGDPVTNYLNKIKNRVLENEPELRDEVEVFTLKSGVVNAFCTFDGKIYVSLALIARAQSEGELAYMLSHEIAHYALKHSLEGLKVHKEVKELSKARSKLSLDDILKFKFRRSRAHEFEADSLGYIIFSKSPYSSASALDLFTCLANSHIPVGDKPFDQDFFNDEFLKVPSCFFLDDINEVVERGGYNDEYLTHPDLAKRKEKVGQFIAGSESGEKFLSPVDEFNDIRQKASFELVQRLLIGRNYGDAIFTAYNLLKEFPDSEYLHVCLAKALYGACVYKNMQKFHYANSSYFKSQGESQQVRYMLKHLTASQLNTLSLKTVIRMRNQFPDNRYLDILETALIEELVLTHDLSLQDFLDVDESEEFYDELFVQSKPDASFSKIRLRNHYKNFYLLGLASEKEDIIIKDKFRNAFKKRNEILERGALTYKERKKADKLEQKNIKKNGYGIRAKNILFFEPDYFKVEKQIKKSVESSQNDKAEILNMILPELKKFNKNIKYVSSVQLKHDDASYYNDYSTLASWIQERESHLKFTKMVPVNGEPMLNNERFSSYKYICTIDIVKLKKKAVGYVFFLYDKETGERVYYHVKRANKNLSTKKLAKLILEDFENIIN
ncbi:M48 family metallopeptidase [Cytophagaceae bacterium ABcell3]|nr:M48 family metallopeptidase [Cytophagaceae bacterium ABcell3]